MAARARIGRYELLLRLARGGMAELHLARPVAHQRFARLVAIKRILPHLADDPAFVAMFLNEGRIAARLSHPNVCAVHELIEDGGELALVMEHLTGAAWDEVASAAPRTPWGARLAIGVLSQACAGLHHAHTLRAPGGAATPIVHRDVSPQNLFVTGEGVCKVLDFGISKQLGDPRYTATGVIKGKLPYLAPEQLRGEAVDARADLWALGVVLWEAIAGRRLFERATEFLTYEAIHDAVVPALGVPALDAVIGRALQRD
ncbi:MAG TPA: serine/threonine-protein kinase, partial [Kofleriaceae bacterium]|nr:serine/threonine-protein kinase [Kofleriaceae bacterium]